jgi:hypothetical protein
MQSSLGDTTWTREQWTGDDKPFMAIRQRIAGLVKQKRKTELQAFVEQYERAARDRPTSAQAQFAWGMALVEARRAGLDLPAYMVTEPVYHALGKPNSPKSYQYVRLRFIMAMWWWNFDLRQLSDRLIKRSPRDYDVKFYSIDALLSTTQDRQKALRYAKDLVATRPDQAGYAKLGFVQMSIFYDDKVQSAGNEAIAAYQKWLAITPDTQTNAQRRRRAEGFIQRIRARQQRG